MFQFFLTAYPWDLVHDDLDGVLDRLHGEVGVTGLSVWIGVPPVSQLRVREVTPRVFRTRGGVFFHPDGERYASTRCKPMMSEWVKSRRPLQRLSDACQDRGMTFRTVVSASRTGRLVGRHPEMACKNAFGDESQSSLCLANPDVQAYLSGLVSDLSARDGVSGVTIADFALGWTDAWADVVDSPTSIGDAELRLLSICFCESCQQGATSAGVDVGMARRSAQTFLQRTFDRGSPTSEAEFGSHISDDQPLVEFNAWRTKVLSSLLKRLVDACSCELVLDRQLSEYICGWGTELDFTLPSAVVSTMHVPEELPGPLICPHAQRNELRIPIDAALEPDASEVVRILPQAVDAGFSVVEMSDHGLLPDVAFVPIKQAIRFAKRSAGD